MHLSEFLKEQYGPGEQHESVNELSLACDVSPRMIALVIDRGHADMVTLRKLSAGLGVSELELMMLSEKAAPEEARQSAKFISMEEERIIERMRNLPPALRQVVLDTIDSVGRASQQRDEAKVS